MPLRNEHSEEMKPHREHGEGGQLSMAHRSDGPASSLRMFGQCALWNVRWWMSRPRGMVIYIAKTINLTMSLGHSVTTAPTYVARRDCCVARCNYNCSVIFCASSSSAAFFSAALSSASCVTECMREDINSAVCSYIMCAHVCACMRA
jgi:hypothetical protein